MCGTCYHARKINSFSCKGQFYKSGNFSISLGKFNSFKEVRGRWHIPAYSPKLKGLCHPWHMRKPMKTILKKSVLSEILEGCFYLTKSQLSLDSWRSFVLRILLWWLQKNCLALFWNCLPVEFFTWIFSVLLSAAVVMVEGNLRQRRFRGDGDRTGRASLEQRQPSLSSKIRTLRSQRTQEDDVLEDYRRGKYGFT